MRNGLISVDAYKKSRAFYIYERKLRYCIEVFFRVRKRASGNASMEKVLCVSVLVKFPRAETRAFLPQWKAGLSIFLYIFCISFYVLCDYEINHHHHHLVIHN